MSTKIETVFLASVANDKKEYLLSRPPRNSNVYLIRS